MNTLSIRKSADVFPIVLALLLMCCSSQVLAHSEVGVAGGLLSGFLHPIFGPDHLVAMVAVGLWGAQLGSPATWILPITFPAVMAVGGLLSVAGLSIPLIELGISASALALGAVVAACVKPPLWMAAILVGVFAVFHGHAHGSELPAAVNPLAYGIGFVVSTGLLHLCGIVIGLLIRWPAGANAIRLLGAGIAALGAYFVAMNFV